MTSTRPKSKKTGKILSTIKGKKANWEMFTYIRKGTTYYGNRLVSKNGWIVCTNDGFISKKACLLNIKKVKTLA